MTQRFPVTGARHIATLARWSGTLALMHDLEDLAEQCKLPGFALAKAIVDKNVAEFHADAVQWNLRALAAEGVDLARTGSVNLEVTGEGGFVLAVKPMDLLEGQQ